MRYTYPQLVQLAQNSGFTGQSAYTMAGIAMAESGGDPSNINYSDPQGSYGLTQINGAAHGLSYAQQALDPQTAFDEAYTISNGGTNFHPWSTYNSGAYSQYVDNSAVPSGDVSIANDNSSALFSASDNSANYGAFGLDPTFPAGTNPNDPFSLPDAGNLGGGLGLSGGNPVDSSYSFFGLSPFSSFGNSAQVPGATSGITDSASGIPSMSTSGGDFFQNVFNLIGNLWVRGALITLGILLLAIAGYGLLQKSDTIKEVVRMAAMS